MTTNEPHDATATQGLLGSAIAYLGTVGLVVAAAGALVGRHHATAWATPALALGATAAIAIGWAMLRSATLAANGAEGGPHRD